MTGLRPPPPLWGPSASLQGLEATPSGLLADGERGSVSWPAGPVFDEEGCERRPAREFVLEARRSFQGLHEDDLNRPPTGAVAVTVRWEPCDVCGNVARYETYFPDGQGGRVAASACGRCVYARGLPWLGWDATTYLISADDDDVDLDEPQSEHPQGPTLGQVGRTTWQTNLAARGFAGPDAQGRMGMSFADVAVVVLPWRHQTQPETLQIVADVRNCRRFGSTERIVPMALDADELWLHVVQLAANSLDHRRGHLVSQRAQLPLDVAVARVRASVEVGRYREYHSESDWENLGGVFLAGNGSRTSLDKIAAKQVARSGSEAELDFLIRHHPSAAIRQHALANPSCPLTAKLHAAEADSESRSTLLELDLTREVVCAVAVAILLRPGDAYDATKVAAHPYCPEDLVRGLVDQATRGQASNRVMVAEAANRSPDDRRVVIHEQLLGMSRRGRVLDEVLQVVTRPEGVLDPTRVDWLRGHRDPRIRRVAQYVKTTEGS